MNPVTSILIPALLAAVLGLSRGNGVLAQDACTDPGDVKHWQVLGGFFEFRGQLRSCSIRLFSAGAFNSSDFLPRFTSCLTEEGMPYQSSCLECFALLDKCTFDNCASECLFGDANLDCETCADQCNPAFLLCGGDEMNPASCDECTEPIGTIIYFLPDYAVAISVVVLTIAMLVAFYVLVIRRIKEDDEGNDLDFGNVGEGSPYFDKALFPEVPPKDGYEKHSTNLKSKRSFETQARGNSENTSKSRKTPRFEMETTTGNGTVLLDNADILTDDEYAQKPPNLAQQASSPGMVSFSDFSGVISPSVIGLQSVLMKSNTQVLKVPSKVKMLKQVEFDHMSESPQVFPSGHSFAKKKKKKTSTFGKSANASKVSKQKGSYDRNNDSQPTLPSFEDPDESQSPQTLVSSLSLSMPPPGFRRVMPEEEQRNETDRLEKGSF